MAPETTQQKIQQLQERIARIQQGGGPDKLAKQHAAGKLTARERVLALFDADTFTETKTFVAHRCHQFGMEKQDIPADGVVTGSGTIDGRLAFSFSQDFTCSGGSVGEQHANKIVSIMNDALKCGAPVVGFNDSGGARIQEGVDALSGYGRIFWANTLLSGVVPQISVIAGPCAGGAAYSPAMTDFVIMVRNTSQMFIAGPNVIKAATGEDISAEALGGADAHARISGNIHFVAGSDLEAMTIVRRLLSFLPANNIQDPPALPMPDLALADDPRLNEIVPDDPRAPYDMRQVIACLVDNGDFLEIQADFAPNFLIGFARLGGMTVGVLANQPMHLAGVLDINASDKGARFIRFCNTFNIPLVNLVDVPGFLPGVGQEHGGIIRHGAKLLFSYSGSVVPKLTVIIRKAYGGAYLVMNSKHIRCDINYAWPTAEIAVMGPKGASEVIYRKEIREAADPEAFLAEKIEEYRRSFANPFLSAHRGYIDDVIFPRDTRHRLIRTLQFLEGKRADRPERKHGNIPL